MTKRFYKMRAVLFETLYPYIFANKKKKVSRQIKELYILYKKFGYLPYQYFRSMAYICGDDKDIKDLIPPRFVQLARNQLNSNASHIVDDKVYFASRLKAAGLPTPSVLFVSNGKGLLKTPEGQPLSGEEALRLSIEAGGKVFVKTGFGAGGKGAQIVQGELPEINALRNIHGGCLAQSVVKQHSSMADWNESSLNTIRIDTFLYEEEVSFSGAYLRIGRRGSVVDNFSSGGLVVPIELESGRLGPLGRRKPTFDTIIYTEHPDSGISFADQEIPFWPEVLGLVERAAEVARPLASVGWDIAITDSGPVIIEANANWEVTATQITQGIAQSRLARVAMRMRRESRLSR